MFYVFPQLYVLTFEMQAVKCCPGVQVQWLFDTVLNHCSY